MYRSVLILIIAFSVLAAPVRSGDQLIVNDPWSPEAPPGRTMAGFMHLTNEGPDAIVLVEASSEDFDRVEIHHMSTDEGVMRMRRLDELRIEPGQSVELRSGGYHLMLFDPRRSFRAGDEIAIELVGRCGQTWPVIATVRPRQPGD